MARASSMGRIIVRRIRFSVAFHHVDMMRVVHNAQYFKWFEMGRLLLLNEMIPVEEGMARQLATPVVRNYCEYRHPATYGDDLVLTTKHRIETCWTGSFRFEHFISNVRTKIAIAEGYAEVTIMDARTRRGLKAVDPDIWRRYQGLV